MTMTTQMDRKRRRDDAETESSHPGTTPVDNNSSSPAVVKRTDEQVEVVLVEPFYGGSHKQLVDLLVAELLEPADAAFALVTLPPRKWHWRLMSASMSLAAQIPHSSSMRVLFVTSMVNLAELLGLRPDLNRPEVRKVYYFHENQLTYPFQTSTPAAMTDGTKKAERRKVAAEDFQIGWTQIVSSLAADELVFNSDYNRTSFFAQVDTFIRKIPEQELRRSHVAQQLERKSRVLYFPLQLKPLPVPSQVLAAKTDPRLTIVWNHRWEYDKNPSDFFQVLFEMDDNKIPFRLVVLGEHYNESPEVFNTAKTRFEQSSTVDIVHWGFAESKERYLELLRQADVVVSTSNHEFYGVAVLEAVLCGCYPLVPNRLVYPEFFQPPQVFNTTRQLLKQLKYFCKNPHPARRFFQEHHQTFERFCWPALADEYAKTLGVSISQSPAKDD